MKQAKQLFNNLSSKVCKTPGCTRRIKQNVIDRKPSAKFCYRCFQENEHGRGHYITSGRESRNNRKPGGGNINRASTEEIKDGKRNL